MKQSTKPTAVPVAEEDPDETGANDGDIDTNMMEISKSRMSPKQKVCALVTVLVLLCVAVVVTLVVVLQEDDAVERDVEEEFEDLFGQEEYDYYYNMTGNYTPLEYDPEFSFSVATGHPLQSNAAQYNNLDDPVVVNRYWITTNLGRFKSEEGIFVPGGATYADDLDSTRMFSENADVLIWPYTSSSNFNKDNFAHVELNFECDVYIVLYCKKEPSELLVTGTWWPEEWGQPFTSITHESGGHFPLGDEARWGDHERPELYKNAVVVKIPWASRIDIPHWKNIKVDGSTSRGLAAIFAPTGQDFPLTAHPYPSALPGEEQPVANQKCPDWVHDLYVVNELEHIVGTEDRDWATWHPPIDPMYWCYFNHEHGSYAGHLYKPMLHFTSHHTPDPTTPTGHQDESHGGFKVFSFLLDDGRHAVIMIHFHMSSGGRFFARHHTFAMAIFRQDDNEEWNIEMEVHMKQDYGFLAARNSATGHEEIFNAANEAIAEDLEENHGGQRAFRKINIVDPNVLDPRFSYGNNPLDRDYEDWHGRLNCCKNLMLPSASGLDIEMHEPASAMRDPDSLSKGRDNVQFLEMTGMGRAFVFIARGNTWDKVEFQEDYCSFANGTIDDARDADGLFYTNAYFDRIAHPSEGPGYDLHKPIKQFIKWDMEPFIIGGHRSVTNMDPWNERMAYNTWMGIHLQNIEYSINITEN